jgi:tetratricopeptide (TPR) repeat protein
MNPCALLGFARHGTDGRAAMNHLPIETQTRANDLRTVSFAQLLIELYESDAHGTLLIFGKDDGLRAAVHFEAGRPAAALAEHDARDLQTMLIPLCAWTEGRFEFQPEKDHVSDDGLRAPAPIDPLRLITAAARGPLREDVVDQTITLISDNAMRLAQRLDIKRYAFSAQEALVLAALDGAPLAIDELRTHVSVSERVLRRVLYVLLLTRAISLLAPPRRMTSGTLFNPRALAGSPSQPPEAHSTKPTTPAMPSVMPSQPAPALRGASVSSPAPALRGGASVSTPAPATSQRPSAPALPSQRPAPSASRRAPARPPGHSSMPYAVHAPQHGVSALTPPSLVPADAPESLSTPPQSSPSSRPSKPVVANEARALREQSDALWQRAESLAKRGEYEIALVTARAAIKLGNAEPEREALLGWLIYQHGGAGSRIHPHVWKCMNHALQRDPLCEEALYFKAMLLLRTDKMDQAYAHLQRVLMLNPKHMEAQREVRIIEMRRTHERQQSGFLRRLLTGRPPSGKTNVPKE